MRTIKFRAWDRTKKEMIYEALEIKNIGIGDGSLLVDERAQRGNELDWMQYTGLKDKNGIEIYEGDVVGSETEGKMTVSWDGFYGCWSVQSNDKEITPELLGNALKNYKLEVIGNIYENPELLNTHQSQ